MTAETKGILCPAGEWTAIAVGKTKVLAAIRTTAGAGFFKTAASLPADDPDGEATPGTAAFDFMPMTSKTPFAGAFEDTSTNVYFFPAGADPIVVAVIRE